MAFDRARVQMMKSDVEMLQRTTVSAKFPQKAVEALLAWYVPCWFKGFEMDSDERDPLLIQAVKDGDEASVFMFLLPEFASIVPNEKQVDRSGYTALHWSAKMGDKTITQILLDNGSGSDNNIHSVHAQSKQGRTPLHLAARNGHKDIIKILLAANADVNSKDVDGETPLFESDGETPLFESIRSGCIGSVQLLLNHGANTYFTDRHNQTPLFIATACRDESIV